MNAIDTIFKKDHPFMILQYNCHLIFSESKECEILYEMVGVINNKIHRAVLNSEQQRKTLKDNKHKMTLIYKDNEGSIYDYKDFRSYTKSLKLDLDEFLEKQI